jgi:hypothetical protein
MAAVNQNIITRYAPALATSQPACLSFSLFTHSFCQNETSRLRAQHWYDDNHVPHGSDSGLVRQAEQPCHLETGTLQNSPK